MQITHSNGIPEEYKQQIKDLLILCDSEFIPPLSFRTSSTQQDLKLDEQKQRSIDSYFACTCAQINNFIIKKDKVIGFMSYIEDTVTNPEVYISTIIVHPDYRQEQCAQKLYQYIFQHYTNTKIRVRTWSTNVGHINLLSRLGFSEYRRMKDDRGEGIDTIYFEITKNKKEE